MKDLERFIEIVGDRYVITGGAAMGIRGLREFDDIDILVPEEMLYPLIEKLHPYFRETPSRVYSWREIEFWVGDAPVEIVDGFRLESVESLIERKTQWGRPKDLEDVRLLKEYEALWS